MSLWVKYVPAVFVSLSVINLCILVHACSVWFRLVYSLLPGVSCLSALSFPAWMCWLKTIIWVYILVCVFLFLPRVCTVTKDPIHGRVTEAPCEPHDMSRWSIFVSELFKYLTSLEPLQKCYVLLSFGVTPLNYIFFNWKLHVKLHNHGKLCKCVLQTANDRLAWNSKVINWHKRLKRPMVWRLYCHTTGQRCHTRGQGLFKKHFK